VRRTLAFALLCPLCAAPAGAQSLSASRDRRDARNCEPVARDG
jgi:hypothetical protein